MHCVFVWFPYGLYTSMRSVFVQARLLCASTLSKAAASEQVNYSRTPAAARADAVSSMIEGHYSHYKHRSDGYYFDTVYVMRTPIAGHSLQYYYYYICIPV